MMLLQFVVPLCGLGCVGGTRAARSLSSGLDVYLKLMSKINVLAGTQTYMLPLHPMAVPTSSLTPTSNWCFLQVTANMTNQSRSVRLLLLSDKSGGGAGRVAILQLRTGVLHVWLSVVFLGEGRTFISSVVLHLTLLFFFKLKLQPPSSVSFSDLITSWWQ